MIIVLFIIGLLLALFAPFLKFLLLIIFLVALGKSAFGQQAIGCVVALVLLIGGGSLIKALTPPPSCAEAKDQYFAQKTYEGFVEAGHIVNRACGKQTGWIKR